MRRSRQLRTAGRITCLKTNTRLCLSVLEMVVATSHAEE
jgi:hypothetical protein